LTGLDFNIAAHMPVAGHTHVIISKSRKTENSESALTIEG